MNINKNFTKKSDTKINFEKKILKEPIPMSSTSARKDILVLYFMK